MSASTCRHASGTPGSVVPWLLALSLVLGASGGAQAQRPTAELRAAPTFTPTTVRPEILNASEIVRAMVQAYPPVLRDAAIGGTVIVFFFIDETGRVGNAVLERSSGHAALDQAALEIARLYQFKPAMNRDRVVPVWVTFPLTFRVNPVTPNTGVDEVPGPPAPRRPDPLPSSDLSESPRFTPMTVRPEILNAEEIVAEMSRAYPPLLRSAGVGGTVIVNFFIDETGTVRNRVIDRSSGHPQLDEAALRVAGVYRFTPAKNREQAVPVWVTFPLTFRIGMR